MESALSAYGTCIEAYHGQGVLTLPSSAEHSCRFEAGQLLNGDVILICEPERPLPYDQTLADARFEGTTEFHSFPFRVSATIRMEMNLLQGEMHDGRHNSVAISCRDLRVWSPAGGRPGALRFGLTNFELPLGLETVLLLEHKGSQAKVVIHPVRDHDTIIRRLRTLKGIDITCEAEVWPNAEEGLGSYDDLIHHLCYLLSVARGTKVQWLYRDVYTEDDKLLERFHGERVVKPYCRIPAIHPGRPASEELRPFAEIGYSRLVEESTKHPRFLHAIDAYLDGKAEAGYLELRGLKIAITFELLRHILPNKQQASGNLVIGSAQFARLLPKISQQLKDLLEEEELTGNERAAITTKVKLKRLNSKQDESKFATDLNRLCDLAGFHPDEDEIEVFKHSRNTLVHEGRFWCEATGSRQKPTRFTSTWQEYYFLVSFADRFFLRMLGYGGAYLDWSVNPPQLRTFS